MKRIDNLSKLFQKQKRKKHMKRLSFITQFKIELLRLFTGCRNVLRKMPAVIAIKLPRPKLLKNLLHHFYTKGKNVTF